MSLISFLWRLFGGSQASSSVTPVVGSSQLSPVSAESATNHDDHRARKWLKRLKLTRLRYRQSKIIFNARKELLKSNIPPYKFARPAFIQGAYYDHSKDGNPELLLSRGLPVLITPADLAEWLGIPLGKLAWLVDRFTESGKPVDLKEAHYHFKWLKKRKDGFRLLEIPKQSLREVQDQILSDILQLVKPHPAACGFHPGTSTKMNAAPHVNKEVILKYDLENFYPRMRFSRVVKVFRSLGFTREVSIWLAKLCTSATPGNLSTPSGVSVGILTTYTSRHLPQGAPTSPALANLCAYVLDVRLSGLAKKFRVNYTRYADDITFSGNGELGSRLKVYIRLVDQIIRTERYKINKSKRKVVRSSQRQVVTGVVVNEKLNCVRRNYDQLKATLHNCVKFGVESQNRENHPHFAKHLLGRIASIGMLNPGRGAKLKSIFKQIRW